MKLDELSLETLRILSSSPPSMESSSSGEVEFDEEVVETSSCPNSFCKKYYKRVLLNEFVSFKIKGSYFKMSDFSSSRDFVFGYEVSGVVS